MKMKTRKISNLTVILFMSAAIFLNTACAAPSDPLSDDGSNKAETESTATEPSETTDTEMTLSNIDIPTEPETTSVSEPEKLLETQTITGTLTDAAMNTIEVDVNGEKYAFSKTDAEVIGDGLLLGDTIRVTYTAADSTAPLTASRIEILEKAAESAAPAYEVKGTAASITGTKWDNMLAQRAKSTAFADKYPDSVFVNMPPEKKVVYLTFDDGPDPDNTVSVMNTLAEYGVSGTFFFTGENMKAYSDVVKQVYENGFAIGLHGYDHSSLKLLNEADTIQQLEDANSMLESITGERTSIMRPPYGDLDNATIKTISEDYRIYLWSIDTLDWTQSDSSEILRNIKENLRPGDIILMHAAAGQKLSAEILPQVIEYIQEQGYEIAALPEA